PTLIVVGDSPLVAICRRFSLKNVLLSQDPSSEPTSRRDPKTPLLTVRSQELIIDRCHFSTEIGARESSPAVVWSAVEAHDPDAGRIRLSNSAFFISGPAVVCNSPPGRLEADNCLKLGDAFFELSNWPRARELQIAARHVTLRRAETLCRVTFSENVKRKAS